MLACHAAVEEAQGSCRRRAMADGGGLLLRLRPGRRLVLVFTHDGQNLAVAAESQPEEPPPLPPPAHPPPDAATGPPTAEPAAAPAADLATAPAADPVPPADDGGVEPLPAATTAPSGCASKAKVKVPLSSETYSSEEEVAVEDETAAPKAATKDAAKAAPTPTSLTGLPRTPLSVRRSCFGS